MKKLLLTVGALVVGAVLLLFVCWIIAPNRTIVRNATGTSINDVQLDVTAYGGTKTVSCSADSLAAGESLILRHGMNDSSVRLTYRQDGAFREHVESYVDLWTGEGWLIDVRPGGEVRPGYESLSSD